jgi:RNA recognition motif-containing protein
MNRKIKGNRGKIYVANLPFETGEPELKSLFSNAGDIMSVNSVKNPRRGWGKSFPFLKMFLRINMAKRFMASLGEVSGQIGSNSELAMIPSAGSLS